MENKDTLNLVSEMDKVLEDLNDELSYKGKKNLIKLLDLFIKQLESLK